MEHSFDIEAAEAFGLQEAILIKNFQYWILKNKANQKHHYDGRYWTYNSIKALSELFPYWSHRQVENYVKSLVNQNVLITGNYNNSAYDRTIWYAFFDESIFLNANFHSRFSVNGNTEMSISNTNSNTNNNTNTIITNSNEFELSEGNKKFLNDDFKKNTPPVPPAPPKDKSLFNEWWSIWKKKVGKEKAMKKFNSLKESEQREVIEHSKQYMAVVTDVKYICDTNKYLSNKFYREPDFIASRDFRQKSVSTKKVIAVRAADDETL